MEILNKENAQKLVKPSILAILSQVPVASAFSTFYSEFVNSSWQERVEKTQEELFSKLSKLDDNFANKMKERTNFASLLSTTYQSALKDINEDKIPLYINSLINAIDNEDLDNTKIHIFLNFLSDFTLLHIETLKYFHVEHHYNYDISMDLNRFRPVTYEEKAISIIQQDNPKIVKDIDLLNTVIGDLYAKGVLNISSLTNMKFETFATRTPLPKHTTILGDSFLQFINDYR